jgi:glycosyltransferase involved in cell wall biosynthesis
MAGTGYYALNLILHIVRIEKNNQYTLFLNEDLIKHFNSIEGDIKLTPFKITNVYKRIFIEQIYLPFLTKSLDILHSIGNSVPIFSTCKNIVTIHDIYQFYYPKRFSRLKLFYLKYFIPIFIKKAQKVIAVSHCTKNDLIKYYSKICPSHKVNVIYEASKFPVHVNNLTKSDYILFVGTLEPGKNLISLIKAYDLLPSELKKAYQLRIIGGKGWLNTDIFNLITKLGLKDNIEFKGYVNDAELIENYRKAKCFVLPSLYEGFGLPILEAMSQGCPVITSNISSIPEVAGDAAILVDPNNVKMLSEKIKEVITNDTLEKKLIQLGYENVKRFNWETCAQQTIALYNSIR